MLTKEIKEWLDKGNVDTEWYNLLLEAKKIGLSTEEIRFFLKQIQYQQKR